MVIKFLFTCCLNSLVTNYNITDNNNNVLTLAKSDFLHVKIYNITRSKSPSINLLFPYSRSTITDQLSGTCTFPVVEYYT